MKSLAQQWAEQRVDVARAPLPLAAKICILGEVYARPGSRVIRRDGTLWIKSGRYEFLAEKLPCMVRTRS